MEKQPRVILIDGYGFVFRAYHSLPPLTRPDGTPVGAIYGFVNMLLKLQESHKADYIAVMLDSGSKSFRNDIYDDYKANRPPAPEDLIPQFPIIREAIEALNISAVDLKGYEADDLIATYTKRAREQDIDVTIISSDKDLMQLVDEHVTMYDPMKSKTIGENEVKEKFGVFPNRVLDVLSLMGDASDNVPGVPGIGPKTAALLIDEYGTLEDVLENADKVKQNKRRESLQTYKDDALLSKKLITLCEDVPIDVAIEQFATKKIDAEKLLSFLQEQGFKSLVSRISSKYGASVDEGNDTVKQTPLKRVCIKNIDALERFTQQIKIAGKFVIIALTEQEKIIGFALATEGHSCYIPLGHVNAKTQASFDFGDDEDQSDYVKGQVQRSECLALLMPLFADPAILIQAHNSKALIRLLGLNANAYASVDDSLVLSYVLDAASHSHILSELSKRYLNKSDASSLQKHKTPSSLSIDEVFDEICEQVEDLQFLQQVFKKRLVDEHMVQVYERIERPLISVLAAMELKGVKLDKKELAALSLDFSKRLETLASEIYTVTGKEFNIASPKQLGEILFDDMKLPGAKKTKTGAYVTNTDVLEGLAQEGHVLPAKVIEWRQLAKLINTYTDALQEQINKKTGRVHTHFSMAATSTGRLSSVDPNLQNIPIRTEEGNRIRKAFIAEEGNVLVSADYSQIELRLLAHLADIKTLQEAFHHSADIHAITASHVFGIPLEEIDSATRRKAKAINFGIIYGISAFGLAKQLGISRSDAQATIDAYFKQYPGIRTFISEMVEQAKSQGFVTTLFGRKCFIKDIHAKNPALRNFAERAAVNAPLQGTSADIIKKAMVRLFDQLRQQQSSASLILQVHDELVLEVPENEVDFVKKLLKKTMENIVHLSIPLTVDVGVGNNWQELK